MSKQFRLITNIIIGIVAFLLVAILGLSVFSISENLRTYTADEDSMIYALKDGRYSDLLRYYHQNQALNTESTSGMEECYAVARYFEAALDYKLALQEKDSALEKDAKEVMDAEAKKMGDLSYAKGEIDMFLDF